MTPIHYGKENYDNFANVVMIILKNMVTKMTNDKRQKTSTKIFPKDAFPQNEEDGGDI